VLDRTQPGLPLKPDGAQTMTNNYKQHNTTTLYALEVVLGKVIEHCMPRHRDDEYLKFLKHLERHTDPQLDLYLIVEMMQPTSTCKSGNGGRNILASIYISPQPVLHGSICLSASFET